jgi:hypothetical protein
VTATRLVVGAGRLWLSVVANTAAAKGKDLVLARVPDQHTTRAGGPRFDQVVLVPLAICFCILSAGSR